MNILDLIGKKRDGHELTVDEIEFIVRGYTQDLIPDYQISAFLMAYYFQDMVLGAHYAAEMAALTMAMARSGSSADYSDDFALLYDKHSTGGVGDKLSFICAPIVAACGYPALLLSGRGLGHTGGTLDKMESVPGVRVELSQAEIRRILKSARLVICGATADIAPADKKIYALRDVTGTVGSVGLIAASVLSKKLSVSPTCLVLDVKCGSGAFMKTMADARRLSQTMLAILREVGRPAAGLITNMDQPLGRMIGNSLEMRECCDVLSNRSRNCEDIVEISIELAAHGIVLHEPSLDLSAARDRARRALEDGSAFEVFLKFISEQGGDSSFLEHPERLPSAQNRVVIKSPRSGYVETIASDEIGLSSHLLGAGRLKLTDKIDPAAGIEIFKKIGDHVEAGDELAALYFNDNSQLATASKKVGAAFGLADGKPSPAPLLHEILT